MSYAFARRWIETFILDFGESKERLGELDRISGDGDFAVNLGSALRKAADRTRALPADANDADIFGSVSLAFLDTGGTSGPLLGMWFRDIGRAYAANTDPVRALAGGVQDGIATIQRLAGARVGDSTMIDAMVPASQALNSAAERGETLDVALRGAAKAAGAGAVSTQDITARMGRASYVGVAASGVTDPGAAAIALFFASGVSAYAGK